jgi:hypothetical protein
VVGLEKLEKLSIRYRDEGIELPAAGEERIARLKRTRDKRKSEQRKADDNRFLGSANEWINKRNSSEKLGSSGNH